MLPAAELSEPARRLQLTELGSTVVVVYLELAIRSEENEIRNQKDSECSYTERESNPCRLLGRQA